MLMMLRDGRGKQENVLPDWSSESVPLSCGLPTPTPMAVALSVFDPED